MRQIDRAQRTQSPRRHRVGIAGSLAERCQHTAPAQAAQRAFECGLANRIVDHRHAFATRDCAHALGKVVARVDDGMVAPVRRGDRGFFVRAHCADHGCAEMLGPLAHDQAKAAGGGVNENRIARLHLVGLQQQGSRSHAPDHHRSGTVRIDTVRKRDDARRRDDSHFRIGAFGDAGTGHPIADREAADVRTDGIDAARAFGEGRDALRFSRRATLLIGCLNGAHAKLFWLPLRPGGRGWDGGAGGRSRVGSSVRRAMAASASPALGTLSSASTQRASTAGGTTRLMGP